MVASGSTLAAAEVAIRRLVDRCFQNIAREAPDRIIVVGAFAHLEEMDAFPQSRFLPGSQYAIENPDPKSDRMSSRLESKPAVWVSQK